MVNISIIIVNWNSANYLTDCIVSIYKQTKNIKFEILVIDNGSYDGCDKILKKEFPEVKFIQSKENIGFSRANNLASKYSSGETLLFLNPDTLVIGAAISQMYSFLYSTPEAGAVGCKLLNSDLSLQTSCLQAFPSIINQALDIEYLKLLLPNLKLWGIKPLFSNKTEPTKVDVISGACIMIKREVFEKIGLFSNEYFMYSEDVDLCYKIRKNGYEVYYLNEEKIIHHGGGSSVNKKDSFFQVLLMKESRMIYFKKNKSIVYALMYKYMILLVSLIRIMLIVSLYPIPNKFFPAQNFSYSLQKWKKVLRWSLGLESWTKEISFKV